MAKCELCSKSVKFGIKLSHSHRKTNRTWKPNIKHTKININGTLKCINICTKCLKTSKLTTKS